MKRLARTVLAASMLTAFLGTGTAGAADAPAGATEVRKPHETLPTDTPVTDDSLYQLESKWTRADGKPIELADLRGKVRVLAIFYSTCEYACPIIVGRMKSVQAELGDSVKDDVGFVLVSMDAAHDDPKKLAEYRERMQLEGDWTLLQGSDGDVRELGALLGFRYRQEPGGGYAHSNLISVLDREGRLVHQTVGLDTDVEDTVKAVREQVAKKK